MKLLFTLILFGICAVSTHAIETNTTVPIIIDDVPNFSVPFPATGFIIALRLSKYIPIGTR